MKETIKVLASDFENNNYQNCKDGLEGCPLIRALHRIGIHHRGNYGKIPEEVRYKVIRMFDNKIPIEDFSFEIEMP